MHHGHGSRSFVVPGEEPSEGRSRVVNGPIILEVRDSVKQLVLYSQGLQPTVPDPVQTEICGDPIQHAGRVSDVLHTPLALKKAYKHVLSYIQSILLVLQQVSAAPNDHRAIAIVEILYVHRSVGLDT
jgi:hypothetical protein